MAITGILPVVPTPFLDGRFDLDSFARLVDHMGEDVDGFVLLGSTGEAPSMTVAERREVAAAVLASVPDSLRVVVGVGTTSFGDARELALHAQSVGAAGVLCPAPFYFPNQPEGVFEFLAGIDAVLEVDLVFYDNPEATGTVIAADDVVAWAGRLEHLTTVKLTDHDLDKVGRWQDAGLKVLAGDDPIAFRYLEAGVDGAMIILPALRPAAFRRVVDLLAAADLEGAYRVFAAEILPITHAFGIGDEIATSKAILEEMGIFAAAEVRPPLLAASTSRRRLLRTAMDVAGVPRVER